MDLAVSLPLESAIWTRPPSLRSFDSSVQAILLPELKLGFGRLEGP